MLWKYTFLWVKIINALIQWYCCLCYWELLQNLDDNLILMFSICSFCEVQLTMLQDLLYSSIAKWNTFQLHKYSIFVLCMLMTAKTYPITADLFSSSHFYHILELKLLCRTEAYFFITFWVNQQHICLMSQFYTLAVFTLLPPFLQVTLSLSWWEWLYFSICRLLQLQCAIFHLGIHVSERKL